jgi:integrase
VRRRLAVQRSIFFSLLEPRTDRILVSDFTFTCPSPLNHSFASAIPFYERARLGLKWTKPKYKQQIKLPFIPTEQEIDSLIAASDKKLATLLQLLKETGCRVGEVVKNYMNRPKRVRPDNNRELPGEKQPARNIQSLT